MPYVNILPAEIWLLILEMIIASSLDLEVLCNPISCPDIGGHLRLPWDYGPPCNKTLQYLRLVCRTFNALLGSSIPFHYITRDLNTPIPPRSKVVYIQYSEDAGLHLQRLLGEPLVCGQIVILALPGDHHSNSVQLHLFESLCENSHALCSLRNLTLLLSIPRQGFWSRLNSSFPRLICLVIRGEVKSMEEDARVIFGKLEVLDLETSFPMGVRFPALRHAACTRIEHTSRWISSFSEYWFAGWPLMESLLIREGRNTWKIDWNDLPHLQLLATTSETILRFKPLPLHHPLQHICIDIGSMANSKYIRESIRQYDQLGFVDKLNKLFPTIARITLVLKTPKRDRKEGMVGDFDADSLALIGFTVDHSAGGPYWGGRRIVLERIQAKTRSGGF